MKDIKHNRPPIGSQRPPEQGFPVLYSEFLTRARAGFEIEGGVAPEMPNPCNTCPDQGRCYTFCAAKRTYNRARQRLPSTSKVIRQICEELSIPRGKLAYIPHHVWQYVYDDGSLNDSDGGPELVSGAMRSGEISQNLRKAYDLLKSLSVRCSPVQSAGGHITVSGGVFTDVICANIYQITLYYLPALLALSCCDHTHKRDPQYRDIIPLGEYVDDYHGLPGAHYNDDHYNFVSFKRIPGASGIRLVEFRFPDSLPHPHQQAMVATIFMAIIARAIYESEKGIIELSPEHETWVLAESNRFVGLARFKEDKPVYELLNEFLTFINPELKALVWLRNVELNIMVFQSRWKKNGGWVVKEGEDLPLAMAGKATKRRNQYA